MIEHLDIILVTETVLRIHTQTRQLGSENDTQDTFSSPKPPRVPRLSSHKVTSHKVGSDTRRVITFDTCQNLKGSLIRISEFPDASVMLEQLRVGITPRPQVVF